MSSASEPAPRGAGRCRPRVFPVALASILLPAFAHTASAQSTTFRSVASGKLVASVAGFPAVADAADTSTLARYERQYLGNGWFVLQNRLTRLCLTTIPSLGNLVAETALRDGDPNEQFQIVPASGGNVALLSRGSGDYLTVDTARLGLVTATATAVNADALFVATATDPGEAVSGQPDPLHPRQTIVGFGGALVFSESRLTGNPYASEIFHALFDPVDGLGITYLRIGNNYGISEADAGGYADQNPTLVSGASAALGAPVGVIMSGWGPPAYLKNNASTTAGTLRKVDGAYDYAGYAKWWADSIVYWRDQGIDPAFVSIQNEPEVDVAYISNHFNPVEDVPFGDAGYGAAQAAGYGPALDATFKAFQALPSPPALIGPEPDGTGDNKVEQYMAGLDADEIVAIAHHLYDTADADAPDSFNPSLQAVADTFPTKPKFMTEWFSNNPAMVEAEAIHDTLVTEGVNAYIKWSLANSATVASAIYDDDPTQPATWKYPHGWNINDNYYVMKHYAYFVRPGFQRIDSYVNDPDLRMSAFVDPASTDRLHPRAAVVILNTSATRSIPFGLGVPNLFVRSSAVYRTAYSNGERWHALGSLGANAPLTLPPDSIVTISLNAD